MKIGRTDDQVDALIASLEGFDLQAELNFKALFDAMFFRSFPYVEKIASSFRPPFADIMNTFPDGESDTPGVGASGASQSEHHSAA